MTIKNEFILILLLGLLLTGLIGLGIQGLPALLPLLRLMLGLVFVLFVPGYCLQTAIFPRSSQLTGPERLALSFGLSLAIIPPLALILNYIWSLQTGPISLTLGVFILVCSIVALYRRQRLPPQERFVLTIQFKPSEWWKSQDRTGRLLFGILALALVSVFISIIVLTQLPPPNIHNTEFYALGPEGLAEGYPLEVTVGQPVNVSLGVRNSEGESSIFFIIIASNDQVIVKLGPISLEDGAIWEAPVQFAMSTPGQDQKIELFLNRQGQTSPYRSLRIWVTVKPNE